PNHYRSGACRGIAQLVERRSPKPQVAGSSPAAPAISSNRAGKGLEHGTKLAISGPLMHIDAIAGTERLDGSDAAFDNKAGWATCVDRESALCRHDRHATLGAGSPALRV